jgi:hypothetical protein
MADKTLQQDTRTFQIHPRRRLIAAALSVAIAVVLAVVVWVDHANGIPFRIIWDLVWILIALIAIRIARLGVQVRRDQLIIRGFSARARSMPAKLAGSRWCGDITSSLAPSGYRTSISMAVTASGSQFLWLAGHAPGRQPRWSRTPRRSPPSSVFRCVADDVW